MTIFLSSDSFHHVFEHWLNICGAQSSVHSQKEIELMEWALWAQKTNKQTKMRFGYLLVIGPNIPLLVLQLFFCNSPFTFLVSYVMRSYLNSMRKNRKIERTGLVNFKCYKGNKIWNKVFTIRNSLLFNFGRNKTLTFWLLLLSKVQSPTIINLNHLRNVNVLLSLRG